MPDDSENGSSAKGLPRCSTGVPGLDEILHGGLIEGRSYLARGDPGAGKTILGYHFLHEGLERGESTLMVNLEENPEDLRRNAATLGIDLSDVTFLDLSPSAEGLLTETGYDVFEPADVEGPEVVERIVDAVEENDPDRVFLDPASQLFHLSPDAYQFRKRVLSLGRFIQQRDATLLMASSRGVENIDQTLQYVTHGTIELYMEPWGRSIAVSKLRGSSMSPGRHDLQIGDDGFEVYPQLRPGEHQADFVEETISSGVPELDQQLHGGLERGTVTIVSGPTGVGKSTMSVAFAREAAQRGEPSIVYLFEESEATLRSRSRSIGMPLDGVIDEGAMRIEEIEPLERSADEFGQRVRAAVEEGVEVLVLDAVAGYRLSLRGPEGDANRKLHAVGRYLRNMGVTTIIIDEIREIVGGVKPTDSQLSYLADNIVFLRYIETQGELRKVVGVLKKRVSDFERTIRELKITEDGLEVGERLEGLHGVLGGIPRFMDET